MFSPKFVCLDSSTWGHLSKDRKKDSHAQRIIPILNLGTLVPYFTWHHIEEICQHADDLIYENRVSLIHSLRFVAFPKQSRQIANVGNIIDLQSFEIMAMLHNPTLSFEQLTNIVRPNITNGFCSGREFCAANRSWWDIDRTHFATQRQARNAQIASIVQFPMGDKKTKISNSSEGLRLRSEADAKVQFAKMTGLLAMRLRNDGDQRLSDPEQLAADFMRQTYAEGLSMHSMEGDNFDRLLQLYRVDRSRLPKNFTMEDVGYEGIFRKILELHESWLSLPHNSLHTVLKQDMIPSWIVWREVDRAMKNFPKAAASNLNDKAIIPFALYVDGLECDKRVRDSVKQAMKRHRLLAMIEKKLLRRKNYADLMLQLEHIAAA